MEKGPLLNPKINPIIMLDILCTLFELMLYTQVNIFSVVLGPLPCIEPVSSVLLKAQQNVSVRLEPVIPEKSVYSKTCLKRPLKKTKNWFSGPNMA